MPRAAAQGQKAPETFDATNLTPADESDGSVIPNSAASDEDMTSDNDQPRADLLGQGMAAPTDDELAAAPQLVADEEADRSDLDSADDSEPGATADSDPNASPWDQLLANNDFVRELVINDALTPRLS